MKNLLIIPFSVMIIYAIFFRLILVCAYSTIDEFERYEEELRSHQWMMVRKMMCAIDFFGGHRMVVGFLGSVGLLLVFI